jgi:LSD1 subclass zinc finger protein
MSKVPCSSCGKLVSLESGAGEFACPACGARNSVRLLVSASPAPALPATAATPRTTFPVQARTASRPAAGGGTGPWKKVLVSLMVIGLFSAFAHPGTFATFNATTSSAGDIKTGALLLDSSYGGADCVSTSGTGTVTITASNSNATCNGLFSSSFAAGTHSEVQVTLKNVGNINASKLAFYTNGSCSVAGASYTTTLVGGSSVTYNGNTANNLCSNAQIVVAETNSSFNATSGYGCISGANPGTTSSGVTSCGYDATHTITALMSCTSAAPCPAAASQTALNASSTRYFVIGVNFPDPGNANNDWQALKATYTLSFNLTQ